MSLALEYVHDRGTLVTSSSMVVDQQQRIDVRSPMFHVVGKDEDASGLVLTIAAAAVVAAGADTTTTTPFIRIVLAPGGHVRVHMDESQCPHAPSARKDDKDERKAARRREKKRKRSGDVDAMAAPEASEPDDERRPKKARMETETAGSPPPPPAPADPDRARQDHKNAMERERRKRAKEERQKNALAATGVPAAAAALPLPPTVVAPEVDATVPPAPVAGPVDIMDLFDRAPVAAAAPTSFTADELFGDD